MDKQLTRRFGLSVLFGILVITGLGLFADLPGVATSLRHFDWAYLPAILGLTLFNYLLRYAKFHYYLGRIGVHARRSDSAAIFMSGLSMAMTPGKVGELLKPILLKNRTGAPLSQTAPVVMAERLTDGIAMLLLASSGFVLYAASRPLLILVALGALALLVIIQNRRLAERLLDVLGRHPMIAQRVAHLRQFYESSYILLSLSPLILAVVIGVVSWFGECLAFYLVLLSVGQPPSALLLVQATFVLGVSSLLGSVSLLPGGLGVADGSVAGLLLFLLHMSRQNAVAATLVIRFSTLWFGVSLGVITLIACRRRFSAQTINQTSTISSKP